MLFSGLKILHCLNMTDLEEVRHYRDPPEGVVKIMDAVCLLFNYPPGWASVKLLLARVDFFQVCVKCCREYWTCIRWPRRGLKSAMFRCLVHTVIPFH